MATRQQIVSQAVKASKPRTKGSGGVAAPPRTAKGHTTGINANRIVPGPIKGGTMAGIQGAPTPGAAAPPANVAPTPWSAKYEQRVGGARKSYLDATANFDLAEQTAKQDYGIDQGYNDYKANPNSRAALLEETFRRNNRGTMSSAGLQLYSGSTSNRLAGNRRNYGVSRDQLMQSYRESLGEISQGRIDAQNKKTEEEANAYWDRVGEAEAAPLDASTAPAKPKKKQQSRKQQTKQAIAANRPAPAPKKKGKK